MFTWDMNDGHEGQYPLSGSRRRSGKRRFRIWAQPTTISDHQSASTHNAANKCVQPVTRTARSQSGATSVGTPNSAKHSCSMSPGKRSAMRRASYRSWRPKPTARTSTPLPAHAADDPHLSEQTRIQFSGQFAHHRNIAWTRSSGSRRPQPVGSQGAKGRLARPLPRPSHLRRARRDRLAALQVRRDVHPGRLPVFLDKPHPQPSAAGRSARSCPQRFNAGSPPPSSMVSRPPVSGSTTRCCARSSSARSVTEWPSFNPCAHTELPRVIKKKVRTLTPEDHVDILTPSLRSIG
jgi:hypothetical protein